jgi:hypothetical protein
MAGPFRLRDAKTVTDQVRRNCGGETAGSMTHSTCSDCLISHQARPLIRRLGDQGSWVQLAGVMMLSLPLTLNSKKVLSRGTRVPSGLSG